MRLRVLSRSPVGFAVDHDVAIGKADGQLYNPKGAAAWVWSPLLAGFRSQDHAEIKIERRVFREHKRVVLLNTLDFLYGHVLLKLWNAQYYLEAHPDLGLVLIIPRGFEWLVPKGTAEDLACGPSTKQSTWVVHGHRPFRPGTPSEL
ncbi:MAG: hypothetical protein IPH53_02425 [Flavobacteriales bacterium]|nr:hypothetical protein [Flavobacteriales bacterium]